MKTSYFDLTINSNSLEFADLVGRRMAWHRRKRFAEARREADLLSWLYLRDITWADLRAFDEVCDHCGRHKVGMATADTGCPVFIGLRIVRLQLAGYTPKLYRPTIINELIKLSEVFDGQEEG